MIQYNWCLDWQRPILSLTQLDFFLLFVSSSHLLFRTLIFFYYPTFFCVSTLVNNIYIHIEPLSVKTKDWVQLPAMTLFWSVDGCVVQLAGHSTVNIHINCAPAMSSHMVQHSIITNRCCCCCCSCYCKEQNQHALRSRLKIIHIWEHWWLQSVRALAIAGVFVRTQRINHHIVSMLMRSLRQQAPETSGTNIKQKPNLRIYKTFMC